MSGPLKFPGTAAFTTLRTRQPRLREAEPLAHRSTLPERTKVRKEPIITGRGCESHMQARKLRHGGFAQPSQRHAANKRPHRQWAKLRVWRIHTPALTIFVTSLPEVRAAKVPEEVAPSLSYSAPVPRAAAQGRPEGCPATTHFDNTSDDRQLGRGGGCGRLNRGSRRGKGP